MAHNAINVLKWVSPKQAILAALVELGYDNMYQTLEPHMIRWSIEAQDLISKPKTEIGKIYEFTVVDNKIILCPEISMVECVHQGCNEYIYEENGSCRNMVTDGCCGKGQNYCGERRFLIDQCYIHFIPSLFDGALVTVKALQRKFGPDGYPMIAELCAIGIQEYIKMKVCFREKDERYNECKQQWLIRCVQCRTAMNLKSQGQVQNMGAMNTPGNVNTVWNGNWVW